MDIQLFQYVYSEGQMKKALLLIDIQNGMFGEDNPVYNSEQLLDTTQYLLTKARQTHTPVFYIQHEAPKGKNLEKGTSGWSIHSRIYPEPQDMIIHKKSPDSFHQTCLDQELRNLQIKHLLLAGIQTEVCVDTTCRRAFSLGYEVTLITDAHSTWDSATLSAEQIITHHNHTLRWFAHTVKASEADF